MQSTLLTQTESRSEIEPAGARRRIPLWVKIPYTAFVAVMVPWYWATYGPTNFLYFCDVAVLVTLVALWTESRLLASVEAVGILVPQALWVVDFTLKGVAGFSLLGLADYMYSSTIPLFARGLSLFHGWLPFLLVWTVWRLGYDRRAFAIQTLIAWVLLPVCFFFTPAPPAPADNPNLPVNINYVYGIRETAQAWMAPGLWLVVVMVVLPACIYLPTHLILRAAFRGFRQAPPQAAMPTQRWHGTAQGGAGADANAGVAAR
jgi:hypothetical protein